MKKLMFVRVGGLSSVNHDRREWKNDYHKPPVKRGTYAFIWMKDTFGVT